MNIIYIYINYIFIKAVYIHPKFNCNEAAPNHDIAILRLDGPVEILDGEIMPICLPLSKRCRKSVIYSQLVIKNN